MLIPEKESGNIKQKIVEELNSLYSAEDIKRGFHCLPWDISVSSEKWKGNCPCWAGVHVLLCWTLGEAAVWAERERVFLLLRIFSFRDGLIMLCLEKHGQKDLEYPAVGFAAL